MAEDHIRYDILAQDALRGVVRKVLAEVARTGIPGDHHFFISFSTQAPGVRVSSRLLAQYPEEMTIVLQHQFWDLSVTEHAFEVGLSFDNVPERLLVPFTALKGFADPSVQFGLQFDLAAKSKPAEEETPEPKEPIASVPAEPAPVALAPQAAPQPDPEPANAPSQAETKEDEGEEKKAQAEVVSLDAFRKK